MSATAEPAAEPAAAPSDQDPAPVVSPPRSLTVELVIHPDDVSKLARLPEIVPLLAGRPRQTAVELVWYDTPSAELADLGLSLCEARLGNHRVVRLEQLRSWPGLPPDLTAQAATIAELAGDLPAPLAALAAFHGQQRSLRLTPASPVADIELWHGTLRSLTAERPMARLRVGGAPEAVFELATALTASLRVSVAATPLAAEALALGCPNRPVPAPRPPSLEAGAPVGEAFAAVVAQLTATLLHHAPAAAAGVASEPVHQMRVAMRRLRSAISLFARATWCAELEGAKTRLKPLAAALGPARDWDVFLSGVGRAVGAAFAGERAVARLLVAAERNRRACYQALREILDGAAFRTLTVDLARLALTRPWEQPGDGDPAADARRRELPGADLRDYARHALSRRLRHARAAGENANELSLADLHGLRIQCKRLRYAAEFFAPLFPGREARRYIRLLSAVQERLGHLNDGAAAGALMAALRGSGAGQAFAVGVVRGFIAARSGDARRKAERGWRKFQRQDSFWV